MDCTLTLLAWFLPMLPMVAFFFSGCPCCGPSCNDKCPDSVSAATATTDVFISAIEPWSEAQCPEGTIEEYNGTYVFSGWVDGSGSFAGCCISELTGAPNCYLPTSESTSVGLFDLATMYQSNLTICIALLSSDTSIRRITATFTFGSDSGTAGFRIIWYEDYDATDPCVGSYSLPFRSATFNGAGDYSGILNTTDLLVTIT